MDAPTDYDAELQHFDEVFERVAAVRPGEDVLDVGCGTGRTTQRAARRSVTGRAVGIDVSEAALRRGREQPRVAFVRGDAQNYPFADNTFDVVISRFGTMFFTDPPAAFANLRRALRPGARLAMMVWQARDLNEWDVALRSALEVSGEVAPGEWDAFSLADRAVVTSLLEIAGFTAVRFLEAQAPVYYGPTVTAALRWVGGFRMVRQALDDAPPLERERLLERLRDVLSEHLSNDGIRFDARAWMVTARTP